MWKTLSLTCAIGAALSFIAGQWCLAFGLSAASSYFWDGHDDGEDKIIEALPADVCAQCGGPKNEDLPYCGPKCHAAAENWTDEEAA